MTRAGAPWCVTMAARAEVDVADERRALAKLTAEVDELRSRLSELEEMIAGWDEPEDAGVVERYPRLRPPTWSDLEAWVVTWVQDILEPRLDPSFRWCPKWYDHPEAVTRLWAMFNSWRQVTAEDDADTYARWMVDVFDRQWDALTRKNGPFANCTQERHSPHLGLRVELDPNAARSRGPMHVPTTVVVPVTSTDR